MHRKAFPVIDPVATGANIRRPRAQRGLSVLDLQAYFGFEEPQVIYKWQKRKSLSPVDNPYALGALLEIPLEEILVVAAPRLDRIVCEPQASACGSSLSGNVFVRRPWTRWDWGPHGPFSPPLPGGLPRRASAVPRRGVSAPWGRFLWFARPSGRDAWRYEVGRVYTRPCPSCHPFLADRPIRSSSRP